MPGIVSLELLNAKSGAANGLATLDGTGKIPTVQLPSGSVETYKGEFATAAAIVLAYPTANIADYAWADTEEAFWYWNGGLLVPAWVSQTITQTLYNALTTAAKSAVPYIIIGV